MFVKLRAGAAAGARMQERWRLNAAIAYEDPVVRVRKRLVTAAWKYRKLAKSFASAGKLQERRLKLAARANIVGYQLTVDDTVDVIAGELGEATMRAQIHIPGVKILQLAILGCAHGVVFFGIFHAKRYSISGGVSLLTRIKEVLSRVYFVYMYLARYSMYPVHVDGRKSTGRREYDPS